MESSKTGNAPARFNVGDRVRVKELPNLFYSRTQMYVRGVSGTIAARTYEDLLPEDETWNRDDAPPEQYYIVRFRQKDLWEAYPFENDTLQTELPDGWLEPAGDGAKPGPGQGDYRWRRPTTTAATMATITTGA